MKRFILTLALGLVCVGCAKESSINWVQGQITVRAHNRIAETNVPWRYVVFFSKGFSSQYHQLEVYVDEELVARSLVEPNRVRMIKGHVILTREFFMSHYRDDQMMYEPLSYDEPKYGQDASQSETWDGKVRLKLQLKDMEGKVLAQTRYSIILKCISCLV